MACPCCGKKTAGEALCRTCAVKQKIKKLQVCPRWVAFASNRMLPPMMFFAISLFALAMAATFDSDAVRLALALASALSGAVGLYILSS